MGWISSPIPRHMLKSSSTAPQDVTVRNRKGWLGLKEAMGVGCTPSWSVSLWEGRIWTHRQTSGYMCIEERPCEGSGRICHGEKPRRNQTCWHIWSSSLQKCGKTNFFLFKLPCWRSSSSISDNTLQFIRHFSPQRIQTSLQMLYIL